MKKYRLLALALTLLPLYAVAADPCDTAVSDPDINECAAQEYSRVDGILNTTYKKVLADLKASGKEYPDALKARQELIKAQRLWVSFREADCNAIFTLHQSGTIRVLMYHSCMTSHSEQRIKELKEFNQ